MSQKEPGAEAELEAFRNEWRAEVSARTQQDTNEDVEQSKKQDRRRDARNAQSYTKIQPVEEYVDELEPKSYHDLPDREEQLRLSNAGQRHDRQEPSTALEHYERGVERESEGQLGDSLMHYRTAFKMDQDVLEKYKKKHFPAQSEPAKVNVAPSPQPPAKVNLTDTQYLAQQFASVSIEAPPPESDASPRQHSAISELPEEILSQILSYAAMAEVATMSKLSQVCKRLAYLVFTEETIWKEVVLHSDWGFKNILYRFACDVEGKPLRLQETGFDAQDYEDPFDETILHTQSMTEEYASSWQELAQRLRATQFHDSWRELFWLRPRVRFNGCYISTVNYTRPSGQITNNLNWAAPVQIVTYYRYLRFFRDGSVISLLTTTEPVDVVHHLIKENIRDHRGSALPSAVMKTALRGRWRLTGPLSGLSNEAGEAESEGELLIETEGSPSRYIFEMRLAFAHVGRGPRNNKLVWRTYHSRNRLTDDSAAFTLKHEKGFFWSRVRSYT